MTVTQAEYVAKPIVTKGPAPAIAIPTPTIARVTPTTSKIRPHIIITFRSISVLSRLGNKLVARNQGIPVEKY